MFLPVIFFLVLCAAAAHFVGAVLPLVVRFAVRKGFTDRPDVRKSHGRPVPPVGGLVIIPSFMALLPFIGFSFTDNWPLFFALGLVLFIGWLDDYYDLAAHWKFMGQVFIGLLMSISGMAVLNHLGHLFGVDHRVDLIWLSIPFTTVCFVFLMNAMNMMDGIDGLAGGGSFVMLLWLGISAAASENVMYIMIVLLLMSILFGFLLHNMRYPGHKRATVFLGDAGSMALGLIIAWLAIYLAMGDPRLRPPGITPIGMAFIIALPIFDAFALFVARKVSGRRAFQAGRDHLHHRLLDRGFSPGFVTFILMMFIFILGGIGFYGPLFGVGEGLLTILWLVMLGAYTAYLVYRAPAIYARQAQASITESGN